MTQDKTIWNHVQLNSKQNLLRKQVTGHKLYHTSRNLEIVLLSSALIPTTFSKSQKNGRSSSDLGLANWRSLKKSKNSRPVPSKKEKNKAISPRHYHHTIQITCHSFQQLEKLKKKRWNTNHFPNFSFPITKISFKLFLEVLNSKSFGRTHNLLQFNIKNG